MNTKSIKILTSFTYLTVAVWTFFLISCGGCGSGKVSNSEGKCDTLTSKDSDKTKEITDQILKVDTIGSKIVKAFEKGIYIQPILGDEIKVSLETHIYENYSIIKLPGGKEIRLDKTLQIIEDIPENFIKFTEFGHSLYLDLNNMNYNLKRKLLGSIDIVNNNDFKEAAQYGRITIDSKVMKNMIIISTSVGLIFGNPGDNYPWHAGSISQHHFYDMDGKLITSISDMDYGGLLSDFDIEKNIVILNRHANEVDDEWDFPEPMIIVFEFLSGKKLFSLRTLKSSFGYLIDDYVSIYSDYGTYHYIVFINETPYIFKYDTNKYQGYINKIDDNNIWFSDGNKIHLDDEAEVKRYTIDSWNTNVKKENYIIRNQHID